MSEHFLSGWRSLVAALLLAAVTTLGVASLAAATEDPRGTSGAVATTSVRGAITPVIADHLRDTVAIAAIDGHHALVVELDTPGGLVTSMRTIVQTFLNSPIPVIVFVSPSGADAGSAGTFITLSAHVAAMAPATTIGAATPVDVQGGEVGDKIVNNAAAYAEAIAEARGRDVGFAVDSVRDGRSITATEALAIGAVDLIATDLDDLLEQIDGRTIALANGGSLTLATADAPLVELDMSGTRRLLQTIADPNLAFIFISLGTLAILYEIANPGLGAGGIIGAIMLVLAFFSLSVLPVNHAGTLLLVLAAGLFVAELLAPGVGVAAVGGTVAFVLGGLFLFQQPTGVGISLGVLVPTALAMLAVVVGTGIAIRRSRVSDGAGEDALIGATATLATRASGRLGVRLDGTWWHIRSVSDLPVGEVVRIVGLDGTTLIVAPADSVPAPTPPTIL